MSHLWGKLLVDDAGSILDRHPLSAHLADVASIFETLISHKIYATRLETIIGCVLDDSTLQRLCCLAAIHDLGKFSFGFQSKAAKPPSRTRCSHVQSASELFADNIAGHARNALSWLLTWDPQAEILLHLLNASLSHHGRCVAIENHPTLGSKCWSQKDFAPGSELDRLPELLREWFPEAFTQGGMLPEASVLQHLFAGLVMLADWIGSDTSLFPFCGHEDRPGADQDPMPFARERARTALVELGLDVERYRSAPPPSFRKQFGFDPNPLQQAIAELPLPTRGSVTLIESETGSGKTEAALHHFFRLFHAGLVDGLFFANPLRLAASQLHGRVLRFARRTWNGEHPAVVLAVPGYLQVDGYHGKALPEYRFVWTDESGQELRSRRVWASEHPKRFCCAPMAVGTIDQALLATLRAPHAHLRAAALTRSLLVIDEAHASDAYMTRLIEELLDLFRAVGGHVLLMSATLGGTVRDRFLAQSKARQGHRPAPLDLALAAPYTISYC